MSNTRQRAWIMAWLLIGPAAANAAALGHSGLNLSANVALVTDYTFRGLSQTEGHPAIQGGFDLSHDSGLYLGTWGSNVDFDDGDQASMELDYYGGFTWSKAQFGMDSGIIYYSYPGASGHLHYDYWEAYLKTRYRLGALSLNGGVDFSPDYFAGSGSAWHYHAGATVALLGPFSLSGSIGYQMIHANIRFGTPDYADWKLALSAAWSAYRVELGYVDTNIAKSECFGGTDLCSPRAVLSVSGAF